MWEPLGSCAVLANRLSMVLNGGDTNHTMVLFSIVDDAAAVGGVGRTGGRLHDAATDVKVDSNLDPPAAEKGRWRHAVRYGISGQLCAPRRSQYGTRHSVGSKPVGCFLG